MIRDLVDGPKLIFALRWLQGEPPGDQFLVVQITAYYT
jgi:hypothetical protein